MSQLTNPRERKRPMATTTAQRAEETRVVDAETGAEKGVKLARFDLVPGRAYWELAEHFGKGSLKYEDRNWEKGYDWGLSIGALERHLIAFKAGEDIDPETGSKHIIAVAWHAFALATFMHTNLERDDRSIDAGLPETLLRNLQFWAEVYAQEAQAAPTGGSDG